MTHEDGAVGSGVASSQPLEERTILVDPDVPRSPYPLYATLRSRYSVYWSEQIMHWIVSRYDDVSLIGPDSRYADLASRTPPLRHQALKSCFYRTRPSRNRCERARTQVQIAPNGVGLR